MSETYRPAVLPALCCACGQVRTVRRYALTIARNRALKCAHCGAQTMHAIVMEPQPATWDWRQVANDDHENLDHIYDKAGTQPPIEP